MEYLPFEHYVECPKCRSRVLMRKHVPEDIGRRPEHLSCYCADCKYAWRELCADADEHTVNVYVHGKVIEVE